MKTLYIIDAVNFLFRSYYAIGPMTNPKGESTNALYGFIRSIFKIVKDFSPEHLVAVFDGPENKKSRTEIYKEYKSHRTGMPEDLFPQIEKALLFCELAGIPHLCVPGVEADDTMGSIAKWAEKKHTKIYICSSDKDMGQLVSDHVFLINPHKDNLLIDKHKVKELFGVTPEQMVDYLAIVGDASDNIPGLEGFGPKTASSLLTEYGSLDYLLEHPDVVKGKKQETLIEGKEIALMSRRLATIYTEVEFPQKEEFFRYSYPDIEKLKLFYQEMHFMTLLKELDTSAVLPSEKKASHQTKEDVEYILVNDEESFNKLMQTLKKHKEISLDTETTHIRPMQADLVGIGFCVEEKKAWYVPCNGNIPKAKILSGLKALFESPHIAFYGHNIKYDLHVLLNVGVPAPKVSFDTMIASYLLSPQNQRHNLDILSLEKFGKVKISIEELIGKGKKQILMSEVPIEKVSGYCCEDVDYTCRLKNLFQHELQKEKLLHVFQEIEIPLLPILTKMERNGIYVDVNELHYMSKELGHELKKLESTIYKMAGEEFNLNSPKQLSVILFEKMGLQPPKKTQTGFSTAADVLESLQEEAPIVKKIIEYRTLEKLRSTYVDSLPSDILPTTQRIHCTFNQSVAATGRLSCQDPNLQNIPVRSEEGKKIRTAFKPQKEGWRFLSADYSQIELRLLAHLSEDPVLIKAFEHGEDIHTYTASLVFDVPIKEVTPEMRYKAKAVNFGILYGQQAYGLSQGLDIEYKEASKFIETYFKRFHKVKEYIESSKEFVRKHGYAMTITGRKRPIPEIHSKNPMLRAAAERLAVNTPLQGANADLIKIAMIRIQETLDKDPYIHALMILQIHDELLFEVHHGSTEKLSHLVKHTMEHVFTLRVPLVVDISIGKNWGEC